MFGVKSCFLKATISSKTTQQVLVKHRQEVARRLGFEPRYSVPKTEVLPLDDLRISERPVRDAGQMPPNRATRIGTSSFGWIASVLASSNQARVPIKRSGISPIAHSDFHAIRSSNYIYSEIFLCNSKYECPLESFKVHATLGFEPKTFDLF